MYFENGHGSHHTNVHKCLPTLPMIIFVRNKLVFLYLWIKKCTEFTTLILLYMTCPQKHRQTDSHQRAIYFNYSQLNAPLIKLILQNLFYMFEVMKVHHQEVSFRIQILYHNACVLQLTSWWWNFMARNMQKSLREIKIIARVHLVCCNCDSTMIFINKTVKISNR